MRSDGMARARRLVGGVEKSAQLRGKREAGTKLERESSGESGGEKISCVLQWFMQMRHRKRSLIKKIKIRFLSPV